jgi:hypothetical protein
MFVTRHNTAQTAHTPLGVCCVLLCSCAVQPETGYRFWQGSRRQKGTVKRKIYSKT